MCLQYVAGLSLYINNVTSDSITSQVFKHDSHITCVSCQTLKFIRIQFVTHVGLIFLCTNHISAICGNASQLRMKQK